ncbi:hypothetical protein CCYA_CCYA19G4718 [Cyanidiococcus yangmingshanensis]|nr:hypothetical protein CCYA_CCYA19G4718 [Cyanidiococcus yangmingshanensis]
MASHGVQEALEDIFGSDEEADVPAQPQTPGSSSSASREAQNDTIAPEYANTDPQKVSTSAQGLAEVAPSSPDDFIDDSAADPSLLREDPDDVIRTEGGWSSGSGAENDDEDDTEAHQHPLTEFDRALRQIQSRRRRKQITSRECERDAERILEKMRSAYDADLIMARLGRPALAKLRLLRQVDTELRRKETRVALIRRGLFEVLRRWLDPLPNGALPSIDVRSTLMDILLTFRTSVSDSEDELEDEETANELQRSLARRAGAREWERALLNSGIGRCIHFYKLYDPDPECRLKAERLVMRWASAVLRSDTSHRHALSKRFEVVPAHRDTRAPSGQGTIGAGQVPEPYHSGAEARAAKETSGSVSVTSKISAQTPVILSASLPERPPTDWTRIPQVEQLPAVPRTRSAREKQMSKHLKRIRDTV